MWKGTLECHAYKLSASDSFWVFRCYQHQCGSDSAHRKVVSCSVTFQNFYYNIQHTRLSLEKEGKNQGFGRLIASKDLPLLASCSCCGFGSSLPCGYIIPSFAPIFASTSCLCVCSSFFLICPNYTNLFQTYQNPTSG